MKIEIELDNILYCDSCPCLFYAPNEYDVSCNLGHWVAGRVEETNIRRPSMFVRPDICVSLHGF